MLPEYFVPMDGPMGTCDGVRDISGDHIFVVSSTVTRHSRNPVSYERFFVGSISALGRALSIVPDAMVEMLCMPREYGTSFKRVLRIAVPKGVANPKYAELEILDGEGWGKTVGWGDTEHSVAYEHLQLLWEDNRPGFSELKNGGHAEKNGVLERVVSRYSQMP